MVDLPGHSAYEPEDRADPPEAGVEADDGGWGSPLPAEYGSLHALRPPERPASVEAASVTGGLFSAWARVAGRRATSAGDVTDGVAPDAESAAESAGAGVAPAPTERPLRPVRSHPSVGAGSGAEAYEREAAADAPTGVIPVVDRDAVEDPVSPAASAPAGEAGSPAGSLPLTDSGPGPDSLADPAPTVAQPVVEPEPGAPWVPAGDQAAGPASPFPAAAAAAAGVAAATEATRPPMPRPGRPLRPGRRPGRARSRVVLRHVDVSTVAKVSVIFYLLVLIIIVVAAVLLWAAADSFGTLPSIQKSVRTLFSLRSFQLHVSAVAMYTAAAGVVIAVVGTIANILLAMIYNFIADVVGGIRVELESFGRE